MSSGQGNTAVDELAHLYKPAVKDVIKCTHEWLAADKDRSNTTLGNSIGVHHSTIGRWLRCVYNGNVAEITAKVHRFLLLEDDRARTAPPPAFAPTAVADKVQRVLHQCHVEGGLGCVLGPTGVGKSMAALNYCDLYPDSLYVYVGSLCKTYSLLRKLCEPLKVRWTQSGDDVLRNIIASLRRQPRLVILDEVDWLPEETLHAIKQMSDEAGVGVVLLGTEGFLQKLHDRRSTTVNQVLGRITHTEFLDRISRDDLGRILEVYGLDDASLEAVVAQCDGEARRAVNLVRDAKRLNGGSVSPKLIAAAAKNQMRKVGATR